MTICSTNETSRSADAINARANSLGLGWRLAFRGFCNGENDLGMADWVIRCSDPVAFRDDVEATEFVVGQCWAEQDGGEAGGLHADAIAFLRSHAPESYVRAVYVGHQCPMPTTAFI